MKHRIEIMQGMADLVQVLRRLLLDEEADRPTRCPEIAIPGMALIFGRKGRADAAIPAGDQFGHARLQGIAVGRREKAFEHQQAIALVSRRIGRGHCTTRCMTTGLSAGAPSPMSIAPRRRAIASSAARSLSA